MDRCKYSYDQAWARLISCTIPQKELAPLLETILSGKEVHDMVDNLRGNEIQTFIDAVGAVRHHTPLLPKNEPIDLCFNFLHSVC